MMLKSWPKIFAVGNAEVLDIFQEPVEITEKIDGSQFNFGRLDGKLYMRSKGAAIDIDNPPNLFFPVVNHIRDRADKVREGFTYHGETLKGRQHNTLKYDNVPSGHLALYGVMEKGNPLRHAAIASFAEEMEVGVVPFLFEGKVNSFDELVDFMGVSALGGVEMEGLVIKNYHRPCELHGREAPLLQAKYVSEKFKEKHSKNPEWKTNSGVVEELIAQYCAVPRWEKAIQHMAERGELTNSVKDIGPLLGEICQDIKAEEEEEIKRVLFKHFWKQISKGAIRGFPQWYKDRVANQSNFGGGVTDV